MPLRPTRPLARPSHFSPLPPLRPLLALFCEHRCCPLRPLPPPPARLGHLAARASALTPRGVARAARAPAGSHGARACATRRAIQYLSNDLGFFRGARGQRNDDFRARCQVRRSLRLPCRLPRPPTTTVRGERDRAEDALGAGRTEVSCDIKSLDTHGSAQIARSRPPSPLPFVSRSPTPRVDPSPPSAMAGRRAVGR